MKKTLALLFASGLLWTGCSSSESSMNSTQQNEYADSLELLDAVWQNYDPEEKPMIIGGFEDTIQEDAPASVNTQNENAALTFQVPEEVLSQAVSAASLQHALLANNLTALVMQFSNGTDLQQEAKRISEYADSAQWICAIPEEYIISGADGFILYCYGSDELVEDFEEASKAVLSNLETYYQVDIME